MWLGAPLTDTKESAVLSPRDARRARLGTSVESAPALHAVTRAGDRTTRTEGADNLKINYDAAVSDIQAKKVSA